MTHTIGNSEVDAFLTCERKHYYAHTLNLKPLRYSDSLSRGIIGHEVLAHYYTHVMLGASHESARKLAETLLLDYFAKSTTDDKDMLIGLTGLLGHYWDCYANDDWTILAVEESYTLGFNVDYDYGMRLDLLVRMNSGPFSGEEVIVDHKFVYDFYSDDDLLTNMQLPKYIGTLQAIGKLSKRAMLNQIRHRTKKGPVVYADKFRRSVVSPSRDKIVNSMLEQAFASERIMYNKAVSIKPLRSRNKMTCRNCSFLNLCETELNGQDASLMIATEFEQNTQYGYNNETN